MCHLAAVIEQTSTISEAGADRMQMQTCQNADAAGCFSAKGFSHMNTYFAK